MNTITLEDLENVVGGGSYELAIEFNEYISSLYAKYDVDGTMKGMKDLLKACTPEERARIRAMRKAVLDASKQEQ